MFGSPVRSKRSASNINLRRYKRLFSYRANRAFAFCLTWVAVLALGSQAQELSNDTLRLKLNVTREGIPVIAEAVWQATGQPVFRDIGTPEGLKAWVPDSLIPAQTTTPSWTITEGKDFATASATASLAKNILITWIVELPKQGQLIRLHVRLTNSGKKSQAIDSFPAWSAGWAVTGASQWVRWWRAVEYTRVEQPLNDAGVSLGSRLYSSDDEDGGVNPYWAVGGPDSSIYFGLQWCGGWSANIRRANNGIKFSAGLPSEATQLMLSAGQMIDGPALLVTPIKGSDEISARATWMSQRQSLGQVLFHGPSPSFPLTYNHWYAVRRRLNDAFLNQQIAAMSPYSFDAFILDAGWFAKGSWSPDPAKFQPKDFARIFASLKTNGIKPGLWSTPQYISSTNNEANLTLEKPPIHNRFLGGDLVDMSQDNFVDYVVGHVRALRTNYSVDYWKYDQPFFTKQSRAGLMRNVIGFQNALSAVRQSNPALTIENCMDGGRMINEFTLLATQISWLKDLGRVETPGPRGNISVALNALDFVFPWAALSFTVNLDSVDQTNDEQLRLYCRSAMAGVWGISTDLPSISARQQGIIVKEIANYRRLNRLKPACLYDLQLPTISADVAGVTFYGAEPANAGILLYRWQRKGAFDQRVKLTKLKPSLMYHVVDVDTGKDFTASGSDLIGNGLTIAFNAQRLSALVFVEPVTPSQKPSAP